MGLAALQGNLPAIEEVVRTASAFTLNVRLTRRCNADCSYCCSSDRPEAHPHLTPEQFTKILGFVLQVWVKLRVMPRFVLLQYLGGEVLTIPPSKLERIVGAGRQFFASRGIKVRDGAQTNLIGSSARIQRLRALFEDRIGTSVDHFSDQRTLAGSAGQYRTVFFHRRDELRQDDFVVPGIFVLDAAGANHLLQEMAIADRQGSNLTIRPVYRGARAVNRLGPSALEGALAQGFDAWFLKQRIIVQPYFGMVVRRLVAHEPRRKPPGPLSGCHFQSECTTKSLHIDPNGDVFLCMEFSDMGRHRLGNAFENVLDMDALATLRLREKHMAETCGGCPYFQECQGGCMAETVAGGGSIRDKSHLCGAWKTIFGRIDEAIALHGVLYVAGWLDAIEKGTCQTET